MLMLVLSRETSILTSSRLPRLLSVKRCYTSAKIGVIRRSSSMTMHWNKKLQFVYFDRTSFRPLMLFSMRYLTNSCWVMGEYHFLRLIAFTSEEKLRSFSHLVVQDAIHG